MYKVNKNDFDKLKERILLGEYENDFLIENLEFD